MKCYKLITVKLTNKEVKHYWLQYLTFYTSKTDLFLALLNFKLAFISKT